jgi:hypothetical protein
MKPSTIATLEKLERVDWFSKVGVPDTEVAVVLSSWDQAIEHCSSVEWENLSIEAMNQYRMRVLERSKDRFNRWSAVAKELQTKTIPLVERKTEGVVRQNSLPKRFGDMVQWDILGVCLESEYADVFPPSFYTSQAFWYVKGHFPCGWQGDFPNGKPIVY